MIYNIVIIRNKEREEEYIMKNDSRQHNIEIELEIEDLNKDIELDEIDMGADDQPDKAGKQGKKKAKNQKSSVASEVFSWILTMAAAVALALVLKNFVIINAEVPTGSMENTIMPGDDLLGFRLAYLNSKPERGDIIIFKFPDDETQKYVKRVIGLPGDTVTINDGKVYINNSTEPLEEDYLKEDWVKAAGPYVYQVPEDSYFVMGDNRNDSYDSRYWINTFVTKDKIIGKALFIYYPWKHMGKLE